MGSNTIIIYKTASGKVKKTHQQEWYENEDEYISNGCKYIDAYNEALPQHRRWAERKIRQLNLNASL